MRITCLKRCTQVRFMSDLDDPTTLPGSVAMPHQGPEHYNNLWEKTRLILKYAGCHTEQFDFVAIIDTDTYIIIV